MGPVRTDRPFSDDGFSGVYEDCRDERAGRSTFRSISLVIQGKNAKKYAGIPPSPAHFKFSDPSAKNQSGLSLTLVEIFGCRGHRVEDLLG